ncbi:hypothetical protein [Caulobacter soli]|uniref:hypothetical protein n=1 Tax=Caulobacter soli TaxID=2708539 RepID=UPI0013ED84F4|nr:hypothetical protein [Caulobacter soli]
MNLTLLYNIVADLTVRAVGLRPSVGAFDLVVMAEVAATKPAPLPGQDSRYPGHRSR